MSKELKKSALEILQGDEALTVIDIHEVKREVMRELALSGAKAYSVGVADGR